MNRAENIFLHTHADKKSANQPEVREDSLALSAVLCDLVLSLQRIGARANLGACTGKVERAFFVAYLMTLHYVVESHFT